MSEIKAGQKLWMSKYALVAGVSQVSVGEDYGAGDQYIYIRSRFASYKIGRDLWLTKAEALKAAEAMRLKKIASLRKQIAKLEKMSFGEHA
jgi:hypothetical protein